MEERDPNWLLRWHPRAWTVGRENWFWNVRLVLGSLLTHLGVLSGALGEVAASERWDTADSTVHVTARSILSVSLSLGEDVFSFPLGILCIGEKYPQQRWLEISVACLGFGSDAALQQ